MLQRLAISDNNSVCFAVHKSRNFNCNLVSKMANLCDACRVRKNEKFLMKAGCLTTGGFQTFRIIRGNFRSVAGWKSPSVEDVIAGAGADLGRGDWAVRPPKTYESNFIRRDFVQFGKQHSRYGDILLSVVLLQECCAVYFITHTVAKPL